MKVALHFNGDRAWTVTPALDAAGIEYDVNPERAGGYDVVMIDSPGNMLRNRLWSWGTPLVLRLRGNLWKERRQYGGVGIRGLVSDRVGMRCLSGVIAAGERLERKAQQRLPVGNTGVAALPIQPDDWPTVDHTDRDLRCVTLTNCEYREKIEPVERYAPLVNALFHRIPGEWVIHGDGEYTDRIKRAVEPLENVRYGGYADAETALERSNLMLHLSNFDISCPNAMLEGAAAGLPVVANGYEGFTESGLPIRCGEWKTMESVLERLRDPSVRDSHASGGLAYIRRHHSPEAVGEQYSAFLEGVA